jgi:glutamyl-tRNA synthetase
MSERKIRVRFAPSPTGPLHMGGVRTALYNYLFAKKHGGDFILRIEDTDQTRFVPGAEQYIIEALKWCGIEPNEGVGFGDGAYKPYRQSERKEMYRQYADQLVKSGNAYYAFDSNEELDEMRKRMEQAKSTFAYNAITRQGLKNSLVLSEDETNKKIAAGENYVIRIKIPRNEEVRLHDHIRGWVVVNTAQMDDKVLYKSDGMPTYHLANVVDDYTMKITHVIRGEEWLPSAPLHVLLYRYLGWESVMPEFAHLPLLLRPDGNGKLSKRDGDRLGFPVFPLSGELLDTKSGKPEKFTGYRESGYFADAFVNMLALLGWHSSGNQELFTLDELVKEFSLERVGKSGAKFDPEKTKWFNQQYLRMRSDEELANEFVKELREKAPNFIENPTVDVVKVIKLIKEKANFPNEFWSLGHYFFEDPPMYDVNVVKNKWNDNSRKFINIFKSFLKDVSAFEAVSIENYFKLTCDELNIKQGEVIQLLRVCLSGVSGGPAIFEMMEVLGHNTVLNRLESGPNGFDQMQGFIELVKRAEDKFKDFIVVSRDLRISNKNDKKYIRLSQIRNNAEKKFHIAIIILKPSISELQYSHKLILEALPDWEKFITTQTNPGKKQGVPSNLFTFSKKIYLITELLPLDIAPLKVIFQNSDFDLLIENIQP